MLHRHLTWLQVSRCLQPCPESTAEQHLTTADQLLQLYNNTQHLASQTTQTDIRCWAKMFDISWMQKKSVCCVEVCNLTCTCISCNFESVRQWRANNKASMGALYLGRQFLLLAFLAYPGCCCLRPFVYSMCSSVNMHGLGYVVTQYEREYHKQISRLFLQIVFVSSKSSSYPCHFSPHVHTYIGK